MGTVAELDLSREREKEDDDDKKKSIAGVPAFLSNWNMEFYNNDSSVNK